MAIEFKETKRPDPTRWVWETTVTNKTSDSMQTEIKVVGSPDWVRTWQFTPSPPRFWLSSQEDKWLRLELVPTGEGSAGTSRLELVAINITPNTTPPNQQVGREKFDLIVDLRQDLSFTLAQASPKFEGGTATLYLIVTNRCNADVELNTANVDGATAPLRSEVVGGPLLVLRGGEQNCTVRLTATGQPPAELSGTLKLSGVAKLVGDPAGQAVTSTLSLVPVAWPAVVFQLPGGRVSRTRGPSVREGEVRFDLRYFGLASTPAAVQMSGRDGTVVQAESWSGDLAASGSDTGVTLKMKQPWNPGSYPVQLQVTLSGGNRPAAATPATLEVGIDLDPAVTVAEFAPQHPVDGPTAGTTTMTGIIRNNSNAELDIRAGTTQLVSWPALTLSPTDPPKELKVQVTRDGNEPSRPVEFTLEGEYRFGSSRKPLPPVPIKVTVQWPATRPWRVESFHRIVLSAKSAGAPSGGPTTATHPIHHLAYKSSDGTCYFVSVPNDQLTQPNMPVGPKQVSRDNITNPAVFCYSPGDGGEPKLLLATCQSSDGTDSLTTYCYENKTDKWEVIGYTNKLEEGLAGRLSLSHWANTDWKTRVVFRDRNNHIREWTWPGDEDPKWELADLSGVTNAPAASGDPVVCASERKATLAVFYPSGTTVRLLHWTLTTDCWTAHEVPTPVPAAGHARPAAHIHDGQVTSYHLAYPGRDRRVYVLLWFFIGNPATQNWVQVRLPQWAGAPLVHEKGDVVSYRSHADDHHYVAYHDEVGHVHLLWYTPDRGRDPSQWDGGHIELNTLLPGLPVVWSEFTAYGFAGTQVLGYRDQDGDLVLIRLRR
jgi:hypothetical protein